MKHTSPPAEIKAAVAVLLRWLTDDSESSPPEADGTTLISHRGSKLGNRRQAAIVRRRLANGQSGALIVGRNFYLTPDAYREELEAISREHVASVPIEPSKSSIADELMSELQRGGAR